jgi:aspartate kinase
MFERKPPLWEHEVDNLKTDRQSPSVIVRKYGGSSLSSAEKIKAVATALADLHRMGQNFIVIVSAMGKSTDQLHSLAREVCAVPPPRELDMLLSTGERVSMALLSMALHERGCHAISFTGSQAGVLTDEAHTQARVMAITPSRVDEALSSGALVVLAGFQGVSPKTKEITTLGRGGSDTTAVAMAGHFRSERCEILKDVEGVFSVDPFLLQEAQHLARLNYDHLLDMTFWGAKVLHYRSVELAFRLKVPLWIGLAHGVGRSTTISGDPAMYESGKVLAINTKSNVKRSVFHHALVNEAFNHFNQLLTKNGQPWPQLLHTERCTEGWEMWWTSSSEAVESLQDIFSEDPVITSDPLTYASVSLTSHGLVASHLPQTFIQTLSESNIVIEKIFFGAMGMSFVIPDQQKDLCVRACHRLI